MFNNWTVGKKLIAGFGLAALTLVVIAAASYRNAARLIDNDVWVAHSHQVRIDIAELISLMKDAETGQRGFLITGDDAYLAPYLMAVGAINAALDEVRRMTSDNPNQQRRLAAAAPLIDTKLAELKQTIDLRRNEGLDAATKVVLTNVGKSAMDQFRAVLGDADQEESGSSEVPIRGGPRQRRHDDVDHPVGRPSRHACRRGDRLADHRARSPTRSAAPSARSEARRPNCRPPPTSRPAAPRSRRRRCRRSTRPSANCWRPRARSPKARSAWRRMPSRRRTRRAPATAPST